MKLNPANTSSRDMKFYWFGPLLFIISKGAAGLPWKGVLRFKKGKRESTIGFTPKKFRASEKEVEKYLYECLLEKPKEIIEKSFTL